MKISLVRKSDKPLCSMKDCCREEGQHYIQIETMFANVSEITDYLEIQSHQGVVSIMEVNLRDQPTVKGTVITQLYQGTVVDIQKEQGQWFYVQAKKQKGWVFAASIEKKDKLMQKEQLKGETHRAVICGNCLTKLDWSRFYVEEIEAKQQHHVINNHHLSYVETSLALEQGLSADDDILYYDFKERIEEEIDSGHHGHSLRFNQEAILNQYHAKRT